MLFSLPQTMDWESRVDIHSHLPSQVELLPTCSINVFLRSEVQLPCLTLLSQPSLLNRDFSNSYPKTYLKAAPSMLFVFLSEPLKFSLS